MVSFSPDEDLGQKTIDQHVELFHEADTDLIKVMCDGYFNYPNPFIDTVTCPEDWFSNDAHGRGSSLDYKTGRESKGCGRGCRGGVLCILQCILPMSLMRFGTSEQLLMMHMKQNPEAVCHAFEVIAQDIKAMVKRLITEAGCDGIYYCVQNAEKFRFSAEEYRRL